MKKIFYKTAILLIVAITSIIPAGINSHAKTDSGLEKACSAAVKAAGNAEKLAYKSETPADFEAVSYKYRKKVASCFFVTSDNSVYNVFVAKAKSINDAKKLKKAFSEYKENQITGIYFNTDYTKTEQNVKKNAIYGRKGKYVWYISMSHKAKNNIAGETALKKKI